MQIIHMGDTLALNLGEGEKWERSAFWLRDHCPCSGCLHPETKQRQVDTFSLAPDIQVVSAEIQQGGALKVTWSDHHSASFPYLPHDALEIRKVTLWDAGSIERNFPSVPFDDVMEKDQGLKIWLGKLHRYGFCFVNGVPATPEATKQLAKRVSYIRETIFGGFWDFTANMEHKDTAYTNLAIGPHTDGTYSFDAPGYQMFHCLAFNGEGGENTLVDGFKIAEILKERYPDCYRALSEELVTGQYIDHGRGIYLKATRPIFRHGPDGHLIQVSFNNLDRAPLYLPQERMQRFYSALRIFWTLANDPQLERRQLLEPGKALLFDNWRILHGRAAYSGYRRLCGAYLNKEDVESRLRLSGAS